SVPGLKFSKTTSASFTKRFTIFCPFSSRKFTVIDFLFLGWTYHQTDVSPCMTRQLRNGSPVFGCSTLMTSAPNSEKIFPAYGAATKLPNSNTRTPSRGFFLIDMMHPPYITHAVTAN